MRRIDLNSIYDDLPCYLSCDFAILVLLSWHFDRNVYMIIIIIF
jgi:hypothetical protein